MQGAFIQNKMIVRCNVLRLLCNALCYMRLISRKDILLQKERKRLGNQLESPHSICFLLLFIHVS